MPVDDRWSKLSMRDRADLIKIYTKHGVTDLNEIRNHYNSFGDNGGRLTVNKAIDGVYGATKREENLGKPSHGYRVIKPEYEGKTEEELDRLVGSKDPVTGHRSDIIKSELHPTHPSRGSWNGKDFMLTDKGLDNVNYTYFGAADGNQDGNARLIYDNSTVLPEITITPNDAYVNNPYDNINLHLKANGGHLFAYGTDGDDDRFKIVVPGTTPETSSTVVMNPNIQKAEEIDKAYKQAVQEYEAKRYSGRNMLGATINTNKEPITLGEKLAFINNEQPSNVKASFNADTELPSVRRQRQEDAARALKLAEANYINDVNGFNVARPWTTSNSEMSAQGAVLAAQGLFWGLDPLGMAIYEGANNAPRLFNSNRTTNDILTQDFGVNEYVAPFITGGIGNGVVRGAYKGLSNGFNLAKNWRLKVPQDPNRYYRYVGDDAIADYINSGVIRSSGANPDFQRATITVGGKPIQIGKTFDYSMFSKGKPWEGSLSSSASTAGKKAKQLNILRSKADTGPTVWEESNVDFRHKGHRGIFRPNYFGDLNATPTQFFEWWEPKRFGYIRHDFPQSLNPWANYMGKGFHVDRGYESSLGLGDRFGSYVGSGGEQTVFMDNNNMNQVLKVIDTYPKNLQKLKEYVEGFVNNRNSVPLQEKIKLKGIIDNEGYAQPVFSQNKIQPFKDMSIAEWDSKYKPLLQNELSKHGYIYDENTGYFSNGEKTLIDLKPENMGLNSDGQLRFIDVEFLKANGGHLGHMTPYGQWQYPHQVTTIPSNNITMQGVDYPVVGVSDTGDKKLMLPGLDYIYDGNYVTEYPVNKYQNGGQINALKQAAMNLKTNSMTNQEFADSLYTKPQQAINFYTTNRFPTVLNRAITNKSVKPLLTSGAPVFYNQVWDKDGNRDKIVGFWDYLHSAKTKEVSKPLTNTQMAALFGNIYQESQFENIKQKNGPADSMLQMEPARQQQYNTWIKQNGYADGDKTKLLYISYLLQNPEKNDLMTPYDTFQKLTPEQQKSDDYKTARKLAQMKEYKNYTTKQAIQDLNSNNIDKTTKAILALFFKAGKPDQARRLKYSRGMVKMFNDRKKNEKR